MFNRRSRHQEADLDITPFMNLMIVLVPVLLLNMVFTHIAILDLQLPKLDGKENQLSEDKTLELIVYENRFVLNYPAGIALKTIPQVDNRYNFIELQDYLKSIKAELAGNNIDKSDIVILAEPDLDYQTLVSTMDAVRSYKTVVVADVVDAELFPNISLGDAPEAELNTTAGIL